MPTSKMIYATIGDKCICLNDSSTINSLFRKQEEGDTRMFLHAKHASSRFREVIVHTPGTDALVLALGYVYSLNCELLINTGVKGKNRIISISRIVNKLKNTFDFPENKMVIQSIIGFHVFRGCDTTSAFRRKEKVRRSHLILRNPLGD